MGSAAGLSGVISSGAFSSTIAQRDIRIGIADDDEAYLGLKDISSNGRSSSFGTPEQIAFSIPSNFESTKGDGLNQNSSFTFDNLIQVTNQGGDTIVVWGNSQSSKSIEGISLVGNGKILDSKDDGITLTPGQTFSGGLFINTKSETGRELVKIKIRAEKPDVNETDLFEK